MEQNRKECNAEELLKAAFKAHLVRLSHRCSDGLKLEGKRIFEGMVQMSLEQRQAWNINQLSWKPLPSSKEILCCAEDAQEAGRGQKLKLAKGTCLFQPQ